MVEQLEDTVEQPELIRQQMEETRTSLAEKLETLEQKVTTTVQDAASAVTDTVETVKESVEASVEAVKNTLDLGLQTERHPWGMVGGSIALGFLGGWLTGGEPRPGPSPTPPSPARNGRHPAGWLSEFGPEIEKLKGLAISTVTGMLRDALAEAVPESIRPRLTEVMDDLTARFGGEPIHSPVLGGQPENRFAPAERVSTAGVR
jgi:hypothetical protein